MRLKKKNVFPGGVHPTDGQDKALTMNKPVRVYLPDQGKLSDEPAFGSAVYEKQLVSVDEFSREDIIRGMEEGGLVGMGGAGFPTHIKYKTDLPIEAVLINGAECEPFLTCDYRLMLECPAGILNGVRLMKKAARAEKAYICIEDNKPEAVKSLNAVLESCREEGIEVKVLPTKYPQGGERQLIQAVLGREVPAGSFPAAVGAMVSNIGTAKATADMVLGKKPLNSRVVTVTGCVTEPGNFLVPVGTTAKELIELCGGVTEKHHRIIGGGPMTGPCITYDWDGREELFCIGKNTSGILVLPDYQTEESPCMRCGGCEQVCPAGLIPYQIDFAYQEEDFDLCESLHASECIACGCCSYTCPAKRELSLRTRLARDTVKQRMRERAEKKA